jgi:hypothetical protein
MPLNSQRLLAMLHRHTPDHTPHPANEFVGNTTDEAIEAWVRYADTYRLRHLNHQLFDIDDLQDTFTDAWDAAKREAAL